MCSDSQGAAFYVKWISRHTHADYKQMAVVTFTLDSHHWSAILYIAQGWTNAEQYVQAQIRGWHEKCLMPFSGHIFFISLSPAIQLCLFQSSVGMFPLTIQLCRTEILQWTKTSTKISQCQKWHFHTQLSWFFIEHGSDLWGNMTSYAAFYCSKCNPNVD